VDCTGLIVVIVTTFSSYIHYLLSQRFMISRSTRTSYNIDVLLEDSPGLVVLARETLLRPFHPSPHSSP